MKRTLKFRVWDISLNKMQYNGGLTVSNNEITDLLGEPMQFTGLLDKNGKEIYEGDVWLMNGIKSQPMIVCFDKGKFCSKSNWGEYTKRDDGYTYWDYIDGAIIGNTYENPELLSDSM
jgi:uncharacterized phage protein (TIGR01671 family)